MKKFSLLIIPLLYFSLINAQQFDIHKSLIRSFKPGFSSVLEHVDLDNDGDPDLIRTFIFDTIPTYWIDDDDDMDFADSEGDMDNDCLIIDRNRDGIFAGPGDLSLDWIDNNNDGVADLQVIVENSNPPRKTERWDYSSNYMWIIDQDQDEVFHYINWKELVLRCWSHYGASNFYEDYHGQTLFLKTHIPSYRFNDLRYSWENPFLFYDSDNDGLAEMTIRLVDRCTFNKKHEDKTGEIDVYPTGKIDWAGLSFDLDNDNCPSNEFDLDMTIHFSGEGFSYNDQIHHFNNMRGLPAADSLFHDKRWRNLDELIYADHDSAWSLIFNQGKWKQCWFIFDEDDDCERWERVEMYEPKNPFKIGKRNGGIDNNSQADASGDRAEWDMDNSGNGNLYIGFDGRIHLFGAEKGYWRIDQDAWSYQGWGGLYEDGFYRIQKEPVKFPTIAYEDTNNDGFFNLIKYDLDGDTIFELSVNLQDLNIKPPDRVINTALYGSSGLSALFEESAEAIWSQAEMAIEVAKQYNVNYKWYAQYLHPKSLNQKYQFGYWVQFYLYKDLLNLAIIKNDESRMQKISKAYYGGNWKSILKEK